MLVAGFARRVPPEAVWSTDLEKMQRDDVAVFVDFENVYVSVREKFDATPNFELIMDRCEDYGRIVIARAYADWYRYPRVTSALFANGVEPMYVPTYYYDREAGRTGRPIKNSVDIHLCIDAMRTLYSQPHILKYVLVTGDRDFIPLVNAIRQQGKEVIIIGIGGAASAHLAQSGDEFLFYEQIADLKAPGQDQVQARMAAAQELVAQPQEGRARNGDRERIERDRNERTERDRTERDRGERDRAERDRTERAERDRPERDRTERPDRPDRKPSRQQPPEPIEITPIEVPAELPTAAIESGTKSPYDTLVDAIHLARQRGFVVNLGSLKVVMRELDSTFHEGKVKDNNGRGFAKFKDFVKEAENRGKVQIFTNGTVTEVFLPGEDPYRLSQFAEDLTPQRVEQELETELAQEIAPALTPEAAAAVFDPVIESPTEAPPAQTSELPPVLAEFANDPDDTTRRTFADREWDVFRSTMSQFSEPVRFTEIFNALRGLRNQEVMELTNNELKELVKQSINRGMLQRTGRGAKAYYRLSSQYRKQPAPTPEQPQTELSAEISEWLRGATGDTSTDSQAPDSSSSAEAESPSTAIVPALTEVRRSRVYDRSGAAEPAAISQEQANSGTDHVLQADVPAEVSAVGIEEPITEPISESKKRRNRRKASQQANGSDDEAAAEVASPPAAAGATAEAASAASSSTNRRRKKTPADAAATVEVAPVPAAAEEGETEAAPKRRRRRKAAEQNGETQG